MTLSNYKTGLRYLVAFFVVALFLFPILWFALTAFKPRSAIFNKDQIVYFDFVPTIESYLTVLSGPSAFSIKESMMSSIIVAIGSTVLTVLISVPAAFGLSRFSFRGRRCFLVGVLMQRFLPPIAIVIPLFYLFLGLDLRDTHLGIVLAHTIINIPLAILLMKSFFDEIPMAVDDMSYIDGATRFQSFWYIVLPTVRVGVAATAVLCFIFSWTEFLLSLFLSSSIRTLPVRVSLFDSGSQVNLIAATGTIAIIPGLLFILLVQKYLVRGLTMGAVKE